MTYYHRQFDKPKSIASKRLERKQRQLIEADESSDEVINIFHLTPICTHIDWIDPHVCMQRSKLCQELVWLTDRQQPYPTHTAPRHPQEGEQVSMMVLPDYSSGSGEKDINVLGFCLRSVL